MKKIPNTKRFKAIVCLGFWILNLDFICHFVLVIWDFRNVNNARE